MQEQRLKVRQEYLDDQGGTIMIGSERTLHPVTEQPTLSHRKGRSVSHNEQGVPQMSGQQQINQQLM